MALPEINPTNKFFTRYSRPGTVNAWPTLLDARTLGRQWNESASVSMGDTDSTLADADEERLMEENIQKWIESNSANVMSDEDIKNRLKSFEKKYHLTSAKLLKLIASGDAPDNPDIIEWKILLDYK